MHPAGSQACTPCLKEKQEADKRAKEEEERIEEILDCIERLENETEGWREALEGRYGFTLSNSEWPNVMDRYARRKHEQAVEMAAQVGTRATTKGRQGPIDQVLGTKRV
jgi:hypothetical protein